MRIEKPAPCNVYLLGFMGCGKSRVGRLVASHLGWSFIDTDACIVEEAGMSIAEIFESRGERGFRSLEAACVERVICLESHVVSLGGGAVIEDENWHRVADNGITIALLYPPEILNMRLKNDIKRPLLMGLEGKERMKRIADLLAVREPVYRKADLVLHFNRNPQAETVSRMILSYLKGRL